ncbi:MAG: hypothetical protein IRZ00_20875, partial [Gemmatimonadetes bacterium]|nr:hypothetical protein [Gemmatimonadota bacterium]
MRTSSCRFAVVLVLALAACSSGGGPPVRRPIGPSAAQAPTPEPPPLPDSSVWGTQVLVVARAADTSVWVGTFG